MSESLTIDEIGTELLPDLIQGIQKPKYHVYRKDTDGGRYYIVKYKDPQFGDIVRYMPSATTIIGKSMPTPKPFLDMISAMGKSAFDHYVATRAAYGSVMHILISELFVSKILASAGLKERIAVMINDIYPLPQSDLARLAFEMQKDLLAFMQFVYDHSVQPLSLELPLASFRGGYCMAIDLLCTMKIEVKGFFGEEYKSGPNKGQPKETKEWIDILAYVDFKSGKKGFYSTHELQLAMGQNVIQETYPDLAMKLTGKDDIYIFNWAPSDWKGQTPTYKLKDQRDQVTPEDMWARIQLGISESKKEIPSVFTVTKDMTLGDDPATMFSFKTIDF